MGLAWPSLPGRGGTAGPLQRRIFALAAALALVIAGAWLWTSLLARDAQIAETQAKAENLANSVAQQGERSIEAADIVLRDLVDRIVASGGVKAIDRNRVRQLLSRRSAELLQVSSFTVADAAGKGVISSYPGGEEFDVTDRAYYTWHRDHPEPGLHISGPLVARASGAHVFVASRGIRTPDGRFDGVVTAALDMRFFQEFYDGLKTGDQGLILLATDEGTILVRHPFVPENVGRNNASTGPLFTQLLQRSPSGLAKTISPVDGIERWNAYDHLSNSNLVVAAALSVSEELSSWRSQAMAQATVVAVIILLVMGCAAYLQREIAERAAAERAAAANAEQYKLLADNSTDVIVRLGFDGLRRYVSPSAATVFGYRPDELVGRDVMQLVHEEDRSLSENAWDRLRRGEGDQIITYRMRRKDGGWIWVETTLSAVADPGSGEPREMVAVIRDIGNRRSMEAELVATVRELEAARDAAEQAARAKSQFLATMSHEIRTPLNGVIGFADLLNRTSLTPEQRNYVELQLEAGKTLLSIINDILDFSKLEVGKLDIAATPVDFRLVVEGGVGWFQAAAREKGLQLDCTIGEDLPRLIELDGPRLQQILANLLSNALKFTRSGVVSVSVRRGQSPRGARLSVAVSDTGIGIPQEKLGMLFQRFSQIDGSISREFGGTGLGLAISQRLAQLMGGGIAVTSEYGVGSIFTLDLPLEPVAPELPQAPAGVAAELPGQLRVLLVEDNRTNQKLVEALLGELGYAIDTAENGEEAVKAVSEKGYDLVLMDVQMPVMDGLQAAARIRALGGEKSEVPIIAITAHVRAEDVARCKAAGMQAHVGKPINRDALLAAIASCIGKSIAA
jgi:PAS domain S-box-containing protein